MSKNKPVNVEVTLRHVRNDPNKLIRKFIKILEEVKGRMYYEKPSSKRRRMKKRKLENARKAQKEQNKKLNIQPMKR